jgi:hypothetical protein
LEYWLFPQYIPSSQISPTLNPITHGAALIILIVNTSPGLEGEADDWYCIVQADSKKIDEVGKVWIPESYDKVVSDTETEKVHLWSGDEKLISEYIASQELNPDEVLRLSWVAYWETPQQQMVIPTHMFKDLDIWTKCFPTPELAENESSGEIDWMTWESAGKMGIAPEFEPYQEDGTDYIW